MKILCLCYPILLASLALADQPVADLGAPPPLTAAEKNRLHEIMTRVQSLREGFLLGRIAPELEKEAERLIQESLPLLDKAERRRQYEAARRDQPAFVAAPGTPDPEKLSAERRELREQAFALFRQYEALEKRIGNPLHPTSPGEWEHLGLSFSRFDERFNWLLRRGLHETKAFDGDLLRRTLMIKAECFLNASVAYHKAEYIPAAVDCYCRGIEILHFTLGLAGKENELLDLYETGSPWFNIDNVGNPWAGSSSRQQTTSWVTRRLLSRYCPWGVPVHRYLHATGLDRGLDFVILRDYSTRGGPRPKLSEAQIPDLVLPHIKRDAEAVVGNGHVGDLVLQGKKTKIRWDWVNARPEYSIWFVSPTVFDLQPHEMLPQAFKVLKVLFSGPLDLVVDETIGVLLTMIQNGYEKNIVSATCSLVVDGNNYGLETSFLLEGEDFNWLKVAKEGFKKLFEWAAEKEIEWLFDCIDPRHELLGRPLSYDGEPIPPVIIRSEVFGFEKVGPYEYRRILRILRFYQLSLKDAALEETYNLQENHEVSLPALDACQAEGAAGNVFRKPWPRLQSFVDEKKPLGSRVYVVDFTPKSQLFSLNVEENTFNQWTATQPGESGVPEVKVKIFTPDDPATAIIEAPLSKRSLALQLFDEAIDPKGLMSNWANLATAGARGFDDPTEAEPRAAACYLESDRAETFALLNQYVLRIERNNEECHRQPLRFLSKDKHPFTGKVGSHVDKPEVIEMQLDIVAPSHITLKANRKDLLPLRCQVNVSASLNASYSWTNPRADGSHTFSEYESRATIIAKVSGFGLEKDWYHGTVTDGQVTYQMWGRTNPACDGAYLQCEVPVSVGRTEYTVTVDGFPPVKKFLVRSGNPPRAMGDPAQDKANLDKAYSRYAANRSDAQARQAYVGACGRYASNMFGLENWQEALRWADEAIKASPGQKQPAMLEVIYDSAWRLGDPDTMLSAFSAAAALKQQSSPGELGKAYLTAMRRCTSLGGDPERALLLWDQVKACYARGGIPNLYYDGYPLEPGPGKKVGQ